MARQVRAAALAALPSIRLSLTLREVLSVAPWIMAGGAPATRNFGFLPWRGCARACMQRAMV